MNRTLSPKQISSDGIDLVKHFESLFLKAYQDTGGVWTIGWGHTGMTHMDGTVKRGRVITEAQAVELLRHDMRSAEADVNAVGVPLSQNEFDALVSWHFNTGGMGKSTLRRMLLAGDYQGAADQFPRWNKDNGRVLRGLTRRRKSERNLFLGIRPFIVPG